VRGHQTIFVVRAGTTEDAFGNQTRSWNSATRNRVDNVQLLPVEGDEETVGRDTVVTRWRLRAHSTIDLVSSDRVEHAGDTYEIQGDVQTWGTPPRGYTTALLERSV